MEHKDILSELYLSGHSMVAEKIFSYLTGADLAICLIVWRTWNQQVSSNTHFIAQVNAYQKQCKENAENLHMDKTEETIVVALHQRLMVKSLSNV